MQQDQLIVSMSLLFCLNYILFSIIYSVQSEPFIDEIFHIPQTIKYCKGQFEEWDSKITTLPGLYFISVGLLMPLSAVIQTDLCTVYGLRAVNMVVSVVNFYLIYSITRHLHKEVTGHWKQLVNALSITLLPPLYFFSFLYYTDVISTCLVLLCYLLHLQHKPWLASIAGFMSVLARQTNIVWVAFFAFETIIEHFKTETQWYRKENISPEVQSSFQYIQVLGDGITGLWRQGSYKMWHFIGTVMSAVIGYVIVGLFFLSFIVYNGSIVVGDKSAHSATIHIPQLLYFSLAASVFSGPHFLVKCKGFLLDMRKNWKYYLPLAYLTTTAVTLNAMAHPYLLADNRHYTFYIWRRLLSRPGRRDLIVPLYLNGLYCIHECIRYKSIIFKTVYWCCVIVTLVPQQLLEFRYFIIPYILFRLQLKPGSTWPLLMELFVALIINFVTVYIFITKTFYWEDSPHPQRIIW